MQPTVSVPGCYFQAVSRLGMVMTGVSPINLLTLSPDFLARDFCLHQGYWAIANFQATVSAISEWVVNLGWEGPGVRLMHETLDHIHWASKNEELPGKEHWFKGVMKTN